MKNKLTKVEYLCERTHNIITTLAVSPRFGRVSRIIFMFDCPLVVGGGLRIRGGALGKKKL